MLVTKTINNNIVFCQAENGKEMIAMGRGLGFDFRPGCALPDERIDKVFAVAEKKGYSWETLLSVIPENLLSLSIKIIDDAKSLLNVELNDSIYLTLTDHINFVINKQHDGIDACSALTGEVKVFYAREYVIGQSALTLIDREMGVRLPDGEASAIALHIVNAEYNSDISSVLGITEKMAGVLNIIRSKTGFDVRDDNIAGASFISFLKFFVFRVLSKEGMMTSPDDRFPSLMEQFRPELFSLAGDIGRHILSGTELRLSRMERAVLVANIYTFTECMGVKK